MSDFSRTFKGKIPLPSPLSVLGNGRRGRAEQQDPELNMLPME